MFKLNPINQRRLAKFRRIKRGWWSLWVLVFAYLASLGSELFVGNRPLFVSYEGSSYFPAITNRYYPETLFGGSFDLETDFRALAEDEEFAANGGSIIMPLHPYSPLESVRIKGDRPPAAPRKAHPMGTDDRGRDILARLLYGFRISMSFALTLAILATALGMVVGAIQGFFGGWTDLLGQRTTEIWSALPFLHVVVLISSIIDPNFMLLIFVLLMFYWIGMSRYVRGEVLRERNRDYATAATALGASRWKVLFRHVVGNSMTPVITLFPFTLVNGFFSLTSLDFLGFGLPAPTPSWGELFKQGQGNLDDWWLIVFPFGALFTTLLLATFIGEAVREAWDPRDHH
ncbi:MAG: ABC transporter permease [Acidobacteriota bacterium]